MGSAISTLDAIKSILLLIVFVLVCYWIYKLVTDPLGTVSNLLNEVGSLGAELQQGMKSGLRNILGGGQVGTVVSDVVFYTGEKINQFREAVFSGDGQRIGD